MRLRATLHRSGPGNHRDIAAAALLSRVYLEKTSFQQEAKKKPDADGVERIGEERYGLAAMPDMPASL